VEEGMLIITKPDQPEIIIINQAKPESVLGYDISRRGVGGVGDSFCNSSKLLFIPFHHLPLHLRFCIVSASSEKLFSFLPLIVAVLKRDFPSVSNFSKKGENVGFGGISAQFSRVTYLQSLSKIYFYHISPSVKNTSGYYFLSVCRLRMGVHSKFKQTNFVHHKKSPLVFINLKITTMNLHTVNLHGVAGVAAITYLS